MMKIVVIHGQSHRGVTYHMTYAVLNHIRGQKDIREFSCPPMGQRAALAATSAFCRARNTVPRRTRCSPS